MLDSRGRLGGLCPPSGVWSLRARMPQSQRAGPRPRAPPISLPRPARPPAWCLQTPQRPGKPSKRPLRHACTLASDRPTSSPRRPWPWPLVRPAAVVALTCAHRPTPCPATANRLRACTTTPNNFSSTPPGQHLDHSYCAFPAANHGDRPWTCSACRMLGPPSSRRCGVRSRRPSAPCPHRTPIPIPQTAPSTSSLLGNPKYVPSSARAFRDLRLGLLFAPICNLIDAARSWSNLFPGFRPITRASNQPVQQYLLGCFGTKPVFTPPTQHTLAPPPRGSIQYCHIFCSSRDRVADRSLVPRLVAYSGPHAVILCQPSAPPYLLRA